MTREFIAVRSQDGHPLDIIDAIEWPRVERPEDLRRIVLWNADELSAAIRSRAVTCVEVMQAYLDHIDRINPAVNAIVALRPRNELLTEAAEKDRLLDKGVVLGWMHGMPQAVKDLAAVQGWTTSIGLFGDDAGVTAAAADSLFVERVRAAGAIFIGRTNTPELGLGSHTYNAVYGTTLNAFDQTKSGGGSSGGAAVAVALRMLPVADGSDFMGSLRNPPGWNNVLGLRPSFGRVPAAGGDLFTYQGGVEGPIARTAQDLALLLSTMSGYDSRVPLSIHQDPLPLAVIEQSDLTGQRIGWLGDIGGYLPMEPEVLAVTGDAIERFTGLGGIVIELDKLPAHGTFRGVQDLWETWLTYRHWSTAAARAALYTDPQIGPLLKPEAVFEIEGAVGSATTPPMTAMELLRGSRKRSDLYEAIRRLFDDVDFIALPTAQAFPFDSRWTWPREINGTRMDTYHRWMEVTTIATLINAPALAIPAGFSATGLPIGLQIIGRNHDEHGLLRFAAAWERAFDYVERHRPALVDMALSAD